MKAAKQQSQELHQAHQYINAILSAEPKKEPAKQSPANSVRVSPIKDVNLKARFSDPPAPPPQQPLPEKPSNASSLKRADTERPKAASPVRSDAQLSTLNEALINAKKEIETQGLRLRDLESLLTEERRAREDAEERANRLERESSNQPEHSKEDKEARTVDETVADETGNDALEDGSASPADDTTARLQHRLETMMLEMNEMKQQMERYRERAEAAESDRKSLAEMIETIRKDNAKSSERSSRRRSRSGDDETRDIRGAGTDASENDDTEEGEIVIIKDRNVDDSAGTRSRSVSQQNGHAGDGEAKTSSKPSNALSIQRHSSADLMYHGGPVGAIVTVVAIGVAVMAMLNQYPKAER
jgi:hypothetical protein